MDKLKDFQLRLTKPFPSLSYNLKASFNSFWTARAKVMRKF